MAYPSTRLPVYPVQVRVCQLREGDEFIVLACDGIWDVMSSQQARATCDSAPSKTSFLSWLPATVCHRRVSFADVPVSERSALRCA